MLVAPVLANHTTSNVLHSPDFKANLLSISRITKEWKCMVGFPNFCIFQDLYTGQVKGIGKKGHGLYIPREKPSQAPKQLVNVCSGPYVSPTSLTFGSSSGSIDVWHKKKLGHAPVDI